MLVFNYFFFKRNFYEEYCIKRNNDVEIYVLKINVLQLMYTSVHIYQGVRAYL